MFNFLKVSYIPILVGMALHIVFALAGQYTFRYIGSNISDNPNSNSVFLFYLSDWFNFAYFVIPGFVAGYVCKGRPALIGLISILLASLFFSVFFQTTWYTYPGILPLIKYSLSSLPIACFGMVSAIAGFSVRSKSSNYAIKVTAE